MDNLSLQLLKLFPDVRCRGNVLNHVSQDKLFQSLIDEQFTIQEAIKKNRKKSFKKLNAEPDSDEEIKQQLQNAVKQYKRNKKQESSEQSVPMNAPMLKTNSKENSNTGKTKSTSTQPKGNSERHRNLRPIENLTLGESETNVNREIESNGSAVSDVKQLINYFFLKKADEVEDIVFKKYKEYEKQGAIPKCFARETLNENSSRDTTKDDRLKSKGKLNERDNQNAQNGVSSDHSYSKNKTQLCKTNLSEPASDGSVVKLCEGTCSRPFFYIVPENPSPNFLFPPGSYYVVPKPPDSATGLSIIVHPETTSRYKINVSENFEIKASQSNCTEGSSVQNMNDLGKEIILKSDSHLNIGPEDVKLNEFWKNLEGNNEAKKSYDKTPGSPNNDAAAPLEENRNFENATGRVQESEDESVFGAWGVTSAVIESELYLSEHSDFSLEKNQTLNSDFFPPNFDSNTYFEEDGSQSFTASAHLNKKIEDQFSRMLAALPESNIQELRDICELFEGNEEQVNNYIEEVKRKDRTREHVLDMQCIFPDADPDYLHKKIEDLGDNDDAINALTLQLLEDKEYPKILDPHIDAERQRLWRIYVDNFSVSDYIRNMPNPKNFEVADRVKGEKCIKLDLEFLQSRYPQLEVNFLRSKYNAFNNNLTKMCTSPDLSDCELIRLADSTFKNKDFDEAFLKEVCYIDNKKEIDEYLVNLNTLREVEEEEARLNDTFLYCPLCCNDELVASEAVTCADGDLFCKDCIKRYVFVKLGDGVYKFSCPSVDCESFLLYTTLEKLLPDAVLSNIIKKQQAAEISTAKVDGLESCPFCEYVYIPNPEDKIFKCQNPSCLIETCRKCHEVNHIPLHCEEIERPQDVEARKKIEESMTEKLVRICPTCFKKFVKIDGCNKMSCTCGTVVCYYCRRKITDYQHFSQLSGKCPLYSNNTELHTTEVIQAGVEARNRILEENPGIRILYDPTTSG